MNLGDSMLARLMTPTEVRDAVIASNALEITIPAPTDGQSIHIAGVYLSGTTGTGAAEELKIADGGTTIHTEAFTVGIAKALLGSEASGPMVVCASNSACVITASATNLTAGILRVLYYTAPAHQ